MSNINYIGNTDTLYLLTKIKSVLDGATGLGPGYVTKDGSKVLSDENFTTTLLNKLNGITESADSVAWNQIQATGSKIATVTINGTGIDIYVPAAPTIDSAMSSTSENAVQNKVIKNYVDTAVGQIVSIEFVVVSTLPETGQNGKIYLVPNGGSGTNVKDEYVWLSGTSTWEKIGSTDVDLSGYVRSTDLVEVSTSDIDTMFTTVFGS